MLESAFLLLMHTLFPMLRLAPGDSFPRPLSREKEQEALARWAEGDLEARNLLVEHNLRLVAHIVKKYYQAEDADDLISIGTIGLIKGINTYRTDKGVRLATYASRCIENEILMHFRSQKKTAGETVVYEADKLSSTESKPFHFSIQEGEVNGFTGLLGSGRSESVRAIFGADRVTGGSVKVKGKPVNITKPHDAMKAGIGYLPEDRKRDGIIADRSVRENIILALQVMKGFFHPMNQKETEKFADEYIKALKIKTASQDTPVGSLSGGNQQKVILARWLLTHPDYLILDEPTRGIDVGTKLEIQKLVLKLAAEENMSITFISSEIEEMLRTCSRLIVMRDRNIVGELTGDDLNQASVMKTIAGGGQ